MTDTMIDAATSRIRVYGFNCPIAKRAIAQGEKPGGLTVQITCGPDDGTTRLAPALRYQIIVDGPHFGTVIVDRP